MFLPFSVLVLPHRTRYGGLNILINMEGAPTPGPSQSKGALEEAKVEPKPKPKLSAMVMEAVEDIFNSHLMDIIKAVKEAKIPIPAKAKHQQSSLPRPISVHSDSGSEISVQAYQTCAGRCGGWPESQLIHTESNPNGVAQPTHVPCAGPQGLQTFHKAHLNPL